MGLLNKYYQIYCSNRCLAYKYIYTDSFSLTKHSIRILNDTLLHKDTSHPLDSILQDILQFRTELNTTQKPKENKPLLVLHYHSKGFDDVHLSRILSSSNVKQNWPFKNNSNHMKYRNPTIGFYYEKPVSGLLFNYRWTVTDLDHRHLQSAPLTCQCSNSKYLDLHHKQSLLETLDLSKMKNLDNSLLKNQNFIFHNLSNTQKFWKFLPKD